MRHWGRATGRRHRPTIRLLPVVLSLALVLISAACGNIKTGDAEIYGIAKFKLPAIPETGSHAIETFTEMHYQPSYKSQEGPRLLPPPDSVPVTGRELSYLALFRNLEENRDDEFPRVLAEFTKLEAPGRFVEAYDKAQAAEIFRVNCMVCHGEQMTGEGPMGMMMKEKGMSPVPANLMLPLTQESTDGELFAFITHGGRQGYLAIERGRESTSPMPAFRNLLSEEERWTLVQYLRTP